MATGTGSGKTECFAYPVLDHCARARKAGESGIKALVIYPMNALATDQARRFAEIVAATPAFAGLRVRMYVGGSVGDPGQGMVMTAKAVITDRNTLRKNPPDILLTNYKMLDYLLLRPKDRKLWERNTSTTLRYLVVDELHVHILVIAPPNMAPSEIMRRLKGNTSSRLFEEFAHLKKRYWGRHFWARGHFCATVGQMTQEMIKQYLEHHFEPNPDDGFKMEPP